jgi:hypothetical protein
MAGALHFLKKACLPQMPGGKAKRRRNMNLALLRLDRWAAGERRSLWDDAPHRKTGQRSSVHMKAKRMEVAIAFVERGMPARAINHLVSHGLAPGHSRC